MAKKSSACGHRANFCSNKTAFYNMSHQGSGSAPLPPVETGQEYIAELMNLTPAFGARDGDVIFQAGTKLRMIGGWDPASFPPLNTTNQQWETPDGITWTQIADAPWAPRHNFGHGTRADGFFWLFGGDDQQTSGGAAQTDCWKFSVATGWVQVTANMGSVFGDRQGYSFCIHTIGSVDYMYVIGGDIFDCIRSSDGITWTKMSDLPAALIGFEQGYACSHRGDIYIVGGYINQPKMYKSSDNGATWTALPDMVTDGWDTYGMQDTSAWCRLISWNTKLFYLAGASTGGNVNGLWYSEDGAQTWKKNYSYPVRPRHAPGFNTFGDDLYVVSGNNATDSNRIYKLPQVPLAYKCVYSVFKSVPTYTGPLIKARNVFGPTADIYPDANGDLDLAALATISGGLNCTVETIYDQSGNGNHITQSNASFQPFIYFGNALRIKNGKPAIYFFDNTRKLRIASSGTVNLSSSFIISSVISPDSLSKSLMASNTVNRYGLFWDGTALANNSGIVAGKQYLGASACAVSTGTQYLLEFYRNRMSGRMWKNGNLLASTVTNTTFTRYDVPFDDFIGIGGEGVSFVGDFQHLEVRVGYHEFDQHAARQLALKTYFNIT